MVDYVPLTVIIPVRNEARNIRECLLSVTWADQVFVVDSHSEDRTVEIAKSVSDRAEIVQFEYNGDWPKKKNWAIKNLPIRNAWFLILDADERVGNDLAAEIADAIRRPEADGYYVCWKFIFLGQHMSHCWDHGWMLRLVRHGKGEYEDLGMRSEGGWDNEVHENIVVDGKTACLEARLVHESNDNLASWLSKQNQYSDWNAVRRTRQMYDSSPRLRDVFSRDPRIRRRILKALYLRLPLQAAFMFIYLYIVKRGFLDGRAGYYFCALRAAHELTIAAKIYELNLQGKSVVDGTHESRDRV